MKKIMKRTLFIIVLLVVFSQDLLAPPNIIDTNLKKVIEEEETTYFIYKQKIKAMDNFLNHIGMFESGNNYDTVNTLGYLGRFQFGKSTLKTIGINVTNFEFLKSPELQDVAMNKLLFYNKERLQKYIDIWNGRTINGRIITESGILAAAHLAGEGNVKKFFNNGKDVKDVYGTSLSKYLFEFSGYDIW